MNKNIQIKYALTILLIITSHTTQSATMEQTVKLSAAGGVLCKIYAEEVGGDVQAFSEMNTVTMQISEKMGYTANFQTYLSEVNKIKAVLNDQLLQKHGSKLNIYNDWCIRFYNGFQNGVAKAYK